jgi:hypothetical protein
MSFLNNAAKFLSPAYAMFGSNNQKNPADAAAPYLNQIAPMAKENLGPWQQQGQQAQQNNQQQYNQMSQNPADFYEQLRSTYTPSNGFQFRQDQAMKAAQGSAAAGGRTSTPANEAAQIKLVNDLLGEDEGAYLDRLFGITGMGLQGNEQIANRGFGASSDLTNILGSTLGTQGGLAYKGQENKNASNAALLKLLTQLAGGAIGGAVGGPAGASIGSNIGGSFGGGNPDQSNDKQLGKFL